MRTDDNRQADRLASSSHHVYTAVHINMYNARIHIYLPGRRNTIQGYGGRGGDRRRSRRETAVDESRQETADRVARYQAD